MRKYFKASIWIFFGVFLTQYSFALEPENITWEQCVKEAVSNSPVLKAKRLALEQSRYDYSDTFNAYFPKISLSHSYGRSGGDGKTVSDSWSAGLSASETLFSLTSNSTVRSAKLNYEQAKIAYDIQSASLRKTLYSAFVALVVAQEQVKVDAKVLSIREANAKLIKLKYESGRESRGNTMYADALYKQAQASKMKSDRALESARRDLLVSMGDSGSRQLVATAVLEKPSYEFGEDTVRTALENTPQILSQRKTVDKYRESVSSAKSILYPTLSATQSLGWNGPEELPDNRTWSIGFSLSLPILSGGITHYSNNLKSAKAALSSSEETLRDLKLSMENDIRSAYSSFLSACDTVDAGAVVEKASEERYKEAQINYMSGNISFIDLETIEQSMVDAQQNQLQYLKNANEQKISLENLLGVTLEK